MFTVKAEHNCRSTHPGAGTFDDLHCDYKGDSIGDKDAYYRGNAALQSLSSIKTSSNSVAATRENDSLHG